MKASEKLRRLAQKTDEIIKDNIRDFDFLLKDIPDQIKKRTQLGKGVSDNGGALQKLKPLESELYKKARQRNKANLDKNTKPNRSNLTATGQMLNSITGVRSGTKFTFSLKDSRKNDLSGNPSRVTNTDVMGFQEKQGRPFFYLAKPEITLFTRKIKDIITERIKKLFKS